jgi:hypothetical protein
MAEGMVLRITGGPRDGEQIEVDRKLTIGRVEADVALDDEQVSRRHLQVEPAEQGVRLTDLGSKNGTLLDGERIEGSMIARPGAEISVGGTTMVVETADLRSQRTVLHTTPRPAPKPEAPAPAPASAWPPPGAQPLVTPSPSPVRRFAPALLTAVIGAAIAVAVALAADNDPATKATTGATPAATGIPSAQHVPTANAGVTKLPSGTGTSAHPAAGVVTDNGPTGSFACVKADNGHSGPGHFRFITSACENANSTVATFPLHRGLSGGKTVYYVITDVSDRTLAGSLGVNYVPKLLNAAGSHAVMKVTMKNGAVVFPATVSFNHTRVLVPGPGGGLPPAKASPPSLAEAGYTPLIQLPNGTVENAPQIINSTGHAHKVLAVDYAKMSVSYEETEGRYENKRVHYASFDSGMPGPATIEDVTYSPALNTVPKQGDEGQKTSAREELVAFINGPGDSARFPNNPLRQGINTTVFGEGDPHNILHETPELPDHADVGSLEYAPMWDVHFAEWTPAAIANGDRTEVRAVDDGIALRLARGVDSCAGGAAECKQGLITGPGGAMFGPTGFVVNCPLISIDLP